MRKLTIGTRGSQLGLIQAQMVVDNLGLADRDLEVDTKIIKTEGDSRHDVSLSEIGGQGVFVKDIERALISGEIDLAVHSLKDMPAELPEGLAIGAVLERGDARDALVGRNGLRRPAFPAAPASAPTAGVAQSSSRPSTRHPAAEHPRQRRFPGQEGRFRRVRGRLPRRRRTPPSRSARQGQPDL